MTNRSKSEMWEERVREWKGSGQSGIKWCKEQTIPYPTFCYWKSKLHPFTEEIAFEELKEPSPSAIELRWGEVSLFLGKNFDIATLEKCLLTLRRTQC